MHGDNVVESTVEVQVDTPVVFYQTKETSLHVSCYDSMHGSVSMQECNNNPYFDITLQKQTCHFDT